MFDGVNQITSHTLKQKSITGFNMSQTISCGIDELQTYANLTFQPLTFEEDVYSNSNFSFASWKRSLFAHAKTKSSDTAIMLVMMTKAANFKEQLVSMKATLDRLSKESVEKDAQIKLQNDQIVELMKKLEKKSSEA